MVGVEALAIIIGYLLGSIPFAYIAGRLIKGVDIRQVGGGNVGALNTMREIGTAAGLGVLVADIAKGALAVIIAQWLGVSLIFVFIAGFAAVLGHMWTVFLKFRGGIGAATTLGVLSYLVPVEFAISFAIMVLAILITSNFRLGMGVGLACLPLTIWGFGGAGSMIAYSLVLPIVSGLRAMPSIKRDITSSKESLIVDRKHKPWQSRRRIKPNVRRYQMSNTRENLQAAFAGESQANRKYLFFAEKADEEGYSQVARLFRAAAESETVHARNHLKAMDGIGSTEDNLQEAVDGERQEFTIMYPGFIEQAKAENNGEAEVSFDWANKVEKVHHSLYQQALADLQAGEQMKDEPYFVCQGCGYTVAGGAPERCPVCGAPKKMFKRVE